MPAICGEAVKTDTRLAEIIQFNGSVARIRMGPAVAGATPYWFEQQSLTSVGELSA